MKPFEILQHTADKAVLARGATFEELLANGARGMFSLVVDLCEVPERLTEAIAVEGDDRETVLVDFLSELLFLCDARGMIFSSFTCAVRRTSTGGWALDAAARGCRYRDEGLRLSGCLKAVTWHGLSIDETPEGLEARIIIDV